MLLQDLEIKDGRLITKDNRTVDQIYKGFQLYKSGQNEFTAMKESEKYEGLMDDVKRKIDKYWEKKDAEEVLKKKTTDTLNPDETHDIRDIEKETKANNYFRRVLFTADRLQLVVMCLKAGEDIGEEVHPTTDQFFRVEEGNGKAIIDGEEILIKDGSSILVKSGRVHNIINTSNNPLKLYSLYSSPQHQDGLIQESKSVGE